MLTYYLLILFCLLAIFFSVMIIISKNPIHSILYLILVFCNVTFVLIILGVEFIAITFLIVYVGAIAVLFLFVVMMLNIKILELDEVFWKYIPVGFLISSCFLVQLFVFVFGFNVFDVLGFFFYDGTYQLNSITMIYLFFSELKLATLYLISGINFENWFFNIDTGINFLVSLGILDPSYLSIIPIDGEVQFIMIPESALIFQHCLDYSTELTNTELLG